MRVIIDRKFYRNSPVAAIEKIRMVFRPGTINLILGSSGAGKSSVISCMTGTAEFEGRIVCDRSRIAYIPQKPSLDEQLTVEQCVYYSLRFSDRSSSESELRRKVREHLREVGLLPLKDRNISELSGGQMQRVAIAAELSRFGKNIVIADEIDTGLDVGCSRALIRNLCELTKANDLTTIVCSHNVNNLHLFDQVYVIAKSSRGPGRIAYGGSPDGLLDYFDETDIVDVFLKINKTDEGGLGMADTYINKYEEGHII